MHKSSEFNFSPVDCSCIFCLSVVCSPNNSINVPFSLLYCRVCVSWSVLKKHASSLTIFHLNFLQSPGPLIAFIFSHEKLLFCYPFSISFNPCKPRNTYRKKKRNFSSKHCKNENGAIIDNETFHHHPAWWEQRARPRSHECIFGGFLASFCEVWTGRTSKKNNCYFKKYKKAIIS